MAAVSLARRCAAELGEAPCHMCVCVCDSEKKASRIMCQVVGGAWEDRRVQDQYLGFVLVALLSVRRAQISEE